MAEQTETKTVELPAKIVIKDFADLLDANVTDVLAELMKNGIMSNLNEHIDYDTARIIAEDLGFTVAEKVAAEEKSARDQELATLLAQDREGGTTLTERPPVVVVMGHVDHGKTKLLDAIRQTDVVARESGGITQHIGAYQVEEKGRTITFIDTPGHEAFTAMRSRGARVADVAILVIAADDGIQQQTKEAIEIIHRAELPFVVAINKIDKPTADVERVKTDLSNENLTPEDWGGKVVTIPVSATTGKGIADLLETVLLVADLDQQRIMSNPKRPAVGTVIESHVDKGEGPVATVIVQSGTLRTGDLFLVGDVAGKVKGLRNHYGDLVQEALPSTPVRILGLKGVPEVGDILKVIQDKRLLKQQMKTARDTKIAKPVSARNLDQDAKDDQTEEKGPKKASLPIVLKADNLGSLEAIESILQQFEHDEVAVDIVASGLGNVTEGDVATAHATKAEVYAFNVHALPAALDVAKEQDITINTYEIIYDLLQRIEENLNTLLSPKVIRTDLGTLKVLAVFRTERTSMIIGGKVSKGLIQNKAKFDIERDGETIGTGTVTQLQIGKQDASEVKQGKECGLKVTMTERIQDADLLHCYTEHSESREVKLSKPRR